MRLRANRLLNRLHQTRFVVFLTVLFPFSLDYCFSKGDSRGEGLRLAIHFEGGFAQEIQVSLHQIHHTRLSRLNPHLSTNDARKF